MSGLDEKDIRNFWIRVYLGDNTDIMDACINRAYRDFNRTMRGIGKEQTIDKYKKIKSLFRIQLESLLIQNFTTQAEFDEWHRAQCYLLINRFNDIYTFRLTIGRAQKWINMSLKYFYAVGDDRIIGASNNYQFYHIPIDNIIQEKLLDKGIRILNTTWSGLDNYEEYMDYQESVRAKFIGETPIEVEFRLFNEE